jgi:hypothetical protein
LAEDRDAVAQLYAAPPAEFVAERTKLARRLRDEGRAEEAREVAALRKPTLPASLANRLARERPRDVAALLGAAEKLAAAHGSGDAGKLRQAQSELGERVRELVALAPELTGQTMSDSVGQRLADTLRAASTDRDAAELLRRGMLQEEIETSGFEALAGLKLAPAKHSPKSTSAKPARTRRSDDARLAELRKELAEARKELRWAESAVTAAEREATRARKRVSDLETRIEKLS